MNKLLEQSTTEKLNSFFEQKASAGNPFENEFQDVLLKQGLHAKEYLNCVVAGAQVCILDFVKDKAIRTLVTSISINEQTMFAIGFEYAQHLHDLAELEELNKLV